MATFQSLGITLAVGSAGGVLGIALFGMAIRERSNYVAPRATARPKNVIWNPNPHLPEASEQNRGNPTLGWVPWVMRLTYAQMLAGVPGTGTRHGGLSGSFLKINLDAVILLRFHALCRRVTTLATVLCLGVLLPLYYTAQCYEADLTNEERCDPDTYNLTDYERTTIANVHPATKDGDPAELRRVLTRLYTTCFCVWIILIHIMYLLSQEWVQVLAMRRVYFLEYNVWQERHKELKATMMYEQDNNHHIHHKSGGVHHEDKDRDNINEEEIEEDDCLIHRDPWIPHPEQRDTIPNIALYSLLVGGLPSLPIESGEGVNTEEAIKFAKRESIDWQLSLTTTFFDHCVSSSMPGFSSSVAAVTILPPAKEMTQAWRKWYTAASRLRRLRFIRQQILLRRGLLLAQVEEERKDIIDKANVVKNKILLHDEPTSISKSGGAKRIQVDVEADWLAMEESNGDTEEIITPRPIYSSVPNDGKKAYYRQVFGSVVDDDMEYDMFDLLTFGPEQAAVYSREFAQAAVTCCPHGCNQERIEAASIEELLDMEQDMIELVHQANRELKAVRRRVALVDVFLGADDDNNDNNNENERHEDDGDDMHIEDEVRSLPPPLSSHMSSVIERPTPVKRNTSIDEISRNLSPARPSTVSRVTSIEADRMGQGLHFEAQIYQRGSSLRDAEPTKEFDLPELRATTPCARKLTDADRARKESDVEWGLVESIVKEGTTDVKERVGLKAIVWDGQWVSPRLTSLAWIKKMLHKKVKEVKGWAMFQSVEAIDTLARHSTYAVVTFTSRQAAVAARNCLADGRGAGRWSTLSGMPIPPLADASTCDICACRNCCRPVTMSINDRQKTVRKFISILLLCVIYIFYTIPLTTASQLVGRTTPQVESLFPKLADWSESALGYSITNLLSGFISACIYTLFFALCPIMFKAISNFGSGALSVAQAEFSALQYFWYFMVLTAFTGQLLVNMVIDAFREGQIAEEFTEVLRQIAITIPSTLSATWLNWIIFRVTLTLPLNYLLNINTFIFSILGWRCCSRVVRGGGPGGATPYRIYVDTGIVFMCCIALGPTSPLVALACLAYFLVMEPLLRRNVIFVYRPNFDAGGARWPFIFEMFISVQMVSVILLTTQMALKQALGPAIVAAFPILPIYMFQQSMKTKYLRAFNDAALLQTSLLDGWDTTEETSVERREEFRRFLVDAHKAAYVPVCIAATDTDQFITAEPAIVIPHPNDIDQQPSIGSTPSNVSHIDHENRPPFADSDMYTQMPMPEPSPFAGGHHQLSGVMLRRQLMNDANVSSSRRRAFSSSAVSVGGGSIYFDPSFDFISQTNSGSIGPGRRGTPRRGTVFTSKKRDLDVSEKNK